MSFFYSLGIKISLFIEKTFKNSKLFVLIFRIMSSVEKSFLIVILKIFIQVMTLLVF